MRARSRRDGDSGRFLADLYCFNDASLRQIDNRQAVRALVRDIGERFRAGRHAQGQQRQTRAKKHHGADSAIFFRLSNPAR